MKNFRGNGETITLVAPAGGVTGGSVYGQGALIGVVVADAAQGESFALKLKGEFTDVKKKAGEAWVIGDKLYFDGATKELTKTPGALNLAGYATADALSADVLGSIVLLK